MPASIPVAPLHLSAPSHPDAVVLDPPVVLAPMAGVTNAAFRQLCYEQGAGLCVCEMITARGLVIGDQSTAELLSFGAAEPIRSVQLYGTDPASLDVAIGIAIESFGAQHVDLNFGCPVPKVTRKGGGGVLPWKLDLVREILRAAVTSADRYGVPVTCKVRIGIDDEHTTFLDMGRLAEDAGIAAICLHARTVAEAYSGQAHWDTIAQLSAALDIPVLGNGDIWEGQDATALLSQTGCAGVEVARGSLGRPWLFADIAGALSGAPQLELPTQGQVAAMLYRHAELNCALLGEYHGMKDMRKHTAWYFKGFPLGSALRQELGLVSSLAELAQLLDRLDPAVPFPCDVLGKPRGRAGSPRRKVIMPHGWLDDRSGLDLDLSAAEQHVSGG